MAFKTTVICSSWDLLAAVTLNWLTMDGCPYTKLRLLLLFSAFTAPNFPTGQT